MSAPEQHPNQSEIDKCLRDAGVSDDLSFQEKLEFYNAIKVSENFNKDTSFLYEAEPDNNVEKENEIKDFNCHINSLRRNRNSKQKTPLTSTKDPQHYCIIEDPQDDFEEEITEKENEDPEWQPSTSGSRQNKNLKRKLINDNQNDNAKRKANDISQKDINIFDCSTSQHSTLTRINIPLVYEKPFLYRKELDRMNFNDRFKAIYNYHLSLAQRYKQALQKSHIFIKWGKPILPSHNFNGSIDKYETSIDGEVEDDEVKSFLSQKHAKDADEDKSNNSPSGAEVDVETILNRTYHISPMPETSTNNLQDIEAEMDTQENVESRIENPNTELDITINDPVLKKNRKFNFKNSSRSEKLFDSFIMMEERKKIEQEEMDSFTQTLFVLSDEENSDFVSDKNSNRVVKKNYSGDNNVYMVKQTQKDENTQWRKRYVPPNPMASKKKQVPVKKGKKADDSIRQSPKSSKRKVDEDKKTTTPLRGKTAEKNKKYCSICRQKIAEDLFQEHIDSCIESVESDDESVVNSFIGTITCDICDNVFEFNTDYEIHVNECLARLK